MRALRARNVTCPRLHDLDERAIKMKDLSKSFFGRVGKIEYVPQDVHKGQLGKIVCNVIITCEWKAAQNN